MRISGFIYTLKKIKKVHGDIELYVLDSISGIGLLDTLNIQKMTNEKLLVLSSEG